MTWMPKWQHFLGGKAWPYVESWVKQKANLRSIHMGSQIPTCAQVGQLIHFTNDVQHNIRSLIFIEI